MEVLLKHQYGFMTKSFINKTSVKIALDHITKHGDTDLFPPAVEIDFYKKNIKLCVEALNKIDDLIINNSSNFCLPASREIFFTIDLKPRIASQLPLLLTLYSTIHAFYIKNKIELIRFRNFNDNIFSYRTQLEQKRQLFSKNYGWNGFLNCQEKLSKNYQWVLKLDIAQFYSSIKKKHLQKIKKNFYLDEIDQKRIDYFYESTNGKNYGLPIGGDYSRLLAETTLYATDNFIKNNNWKFCRFVDDYRIFLSSEQKALNASYEIIDILSKDGFQVNGTKLCIERSSNSLKSHFMTNKIDFKIKNQKNNKFFFDPYSELVVTKVNELKSFSKKSNLLALINLELEKIVPHIMSLKVYIASLSIDHKENLQECFSQLLSTIFDKRYFSLLPNILRLTMLVKQKLKDKFINTQYNSITKKLMISHKNLPRSVIGQILRIISVLSTKLNTKFIDFLYKLILLHEDSLFLKREVINLLSKEKKKIKNLIETKILENPSLESIWVPVSSLKTYKFDA